MINKTKVKPDAKAVPKNQIINNLPMQERKVIKDNFQ